MIIIEFRPATEEDVFLIYSWANDYEVRKNSFNSKKILLDVHKKWYSKMMPFISILMVDNIPVGQVRIGPDYEIDVSVAQGYRGKGYAIEMLKRVSGIAYVKTSNIASIKSFEKAGFLNKGIVCIKEVECYQFVKE